MSEKYTSFQGWFDLEQKKRDAADEESGHKATFEARRRERLAKDVLKLTPWFNSTPEPAGPENATPKPAAAEQSTTGERRAEKDLYEAGWGFFDEGNSLTPEEYQVTANDDLWVSEFVGESSGKAEKSRQPLTPEQKAIANAGTARVAALTMGLKPEDYPTMRHIRGYMDKLQLDSDYADRRQQLRRAGRDVKYQNIRAKADRSLSDAMQDGWQYKKSDGSYADGSLGVDFLHLGRPVKLPESPDKLDEMMRVYVYAHPEYAGAIAAAVIEAVAKKTGHHVYGKLWDVSTAKEADFRDDNLLFYAQRHSDLTAIAESLRKLAKSRPEMFDADARPVDRARKTDIPGVALAEEPVQVPGGIKESFNSHRDEMSAELERRAIESVLAEPSMQQRYAADIASAYGNGYSLRKIIRKEYTSRDDSGKAALRRTVKQALRDTARQISPKYHVSTENFAMNMR